MTNFQSTRTAAHYRIRLKERLDENWSIWFEGMTISSEREGTIMSGRISDQAALHGLLIQIRDLNLSLISVERLEPDPYRDDFESIMEGSRHHLRKDQGE